MYSTPRIFANTLLFKNYLDWLRVKRHIASSNSPKMMLNFADLMNKSNYNMCPRFPRSNVTIDRSLYIHIF